jgi:hypothetical protein
VSLKENNIDFEVLAEICGLHPTKDWKVWKDDAGNTVRLLKNSSVRIYPTKTPNENTTSDIFAKAWPSEIAKQSYWVLLLSGGSHDVTCFVGSDGRLRISHYKNDLWVGNYCPLLIGFGALKAITRGYMESDIGTLSPVPTTKLVKGFKPKKAVVSGWPTSDDKLRGRIQCLIRNDMKVQ